MINWDDLAWLDLDSQEGQEYWQAMNLMGDYAAANHDSHSPHGRQAAGCPHPGRRGEPPQFRLERDPSTAARSSCIAKGRHQPVRGNWASFPVPWQIRPSSCAVAVTRHRSTRHRTEPAVACPARKHATCFNCKAVRNDLAKKGVRVLSAGSDEVPGVYKDIREVMQQQADLVADRGSLRSQNRQDV